MTKPFWSKDPLFLPWITLFLKLIFYKNDAKPPIVPQNLIKSAHILARLCLKYGAGSGKFLEEYSMYERN